jgi:hypothetical protein
MNHIQVLLLANKTNTSNDVAQDTSEINGEPWMILVTCGCIAIDSFHVNNEMHMVIFLPFLQTSYSSELIVHC